MSEHAISQPICIAWASRDEHTNFLYEKYRSNKVALKQEMGLDIQCHGINTRDSNGTIRGMGEEQARLLFLKSELYKRRKSKIKKEMGLIRDPTDKEIEEKWDTMRINEHGKPVVGSPDSAANYHSSNESALTDRGHYVPLDLRV